MDYIEPVTKQRITQVIKNNSKWEFIYMEIAEKNNKIAESIEKSKKSDELKGILEKMEQSGAINYKVKASDINENIKEFKWLSLDEQKQFLLELLDKNQLFLNYSEMDDEDNKVSDTDKKLNKQFYS